MKLEIEFLHKEYKSVLSGYATLLSFRMYNLCVKASPVMLLPVIVKVKGVEKNLENVAKVGLRSDEQLDVYPAHEDLIIPIGHGIAEIHPELKQSLETIHVDEPKPTDFKFLRLTMPDVDKTRYDLLLDGVDAFHNDAKAQIEAAKVKYVARMEKNIFGQPKEEIDETRDMFDNTYNQHVDMIEKTVADKKKEIEDAYQLYQTKQQEKEQIQKERMAAKGTAVINQMKMPGLN